MTRLAVVIAAYDEEENAEALLRRLHAALSSLPGLEWRGIFVVEGRDRTREILERVAAELGAEVRILYQADPSGLGAAFRRGFAAVPADAELVLTMDADLNHQPEEVPRLLQAMARTGADIIVGSRFVAGSRVEGTPVWKRFLSGFMNLLMRWLYGLTVRDKTSGFRLYRAAVLRALDYRLVNFAFLPELLIRAHGAGYRIGEEPIRFVFRLQGRSKLAFWPTSLSYLTLLRMRFDRWSRVALACVLVGVGVRLAAAYPVHKYPADADALLSGMCAERVLRGETPVFFTPARLGSLECHLAAPFIGWLGHSRATLALVPVAIALPLLVLFYYWARRLVGRPLASLALLFLAVPAPALLFWTSMPNGYPTILLLCVLILWTAGGAAAESGPGWALALGAAVGLGLWQSLLTVPCSAVALGWVLAARPRRALDPRRLAALVAGVLIGAGPLLGYHLRHRLAPFTGNFAAEPVASAAALWDNLRFLVAAQLPELVASTDPEGGIVPAYPVSRWLRPPVLAIHLAAAIFLLSLPFRRRPVAEAPLSTSPLAPLAWALLLATTAAFAVSQAGAVRAINVRYLLPLYLLVPITLALLLARLRAWSGVAAALIAAVVLGFNVAGYRWPDHPRRRQLQALAASDRELLAGLRARRVELVLGNYWMVYPLNWLSAGAVTALPCQAGDDYYGLAGRLVAKPYRWALASNWEGGPLLADWGARLGAGGRLERIGRYAVYLPSTTLDGPAGVGRALAACPSPAPGP